MSQIQIAGLNTIGAIDQWMKIIGSNVTGAVVTGFKGTEAEFGQVLESMTRGPIKPTTGYGSVDPISNPDSGIMIKGTHTDWGQGTIQSTGNAANVAINGDAFFAVSKSPVPTSMDDVLFTRNGDFHWEYIADTNHKDPQGKVIPGIGTYRLVNSDGYFAQGYSYPVIEGRRDFGFPPEETQGTDLANLSTTTVPDVDGQAAKQVPMAALTLDQVRNPDAANHITFNAQGLVHVNGVEPRDLVGNKSNMFLTLVKFSNNDGLQRVGGGPYFKYDIVAGNMFAGVAGNANDPPGKIVGASNVITPGAIENANTSINTTMPEITLAQKSFSAATKIVQVGNSMIDDANNLVK